MAGAICAIGLVLAYWPGCSATACGLGKSIDRSTALLGVQEMRREHAVCVWHLKKKPIDVHTDQGQGGQLRSSACARRARRGAFSRFRAPGRACRPRGGAPCVLPRLAAPRGGPGACGRWPPRALRHAEHKTKNPVSTLLQRDVWADDAASSASLDGSEVVHSLTCNDGFSPLRVQGKWLAIVRVGNPSGR